MRRLRTQLIHLLEQACLQHRLENIQPRLAAALVHDFLRLLPTGEAVAGGKSSRIALRSRTISHGDLHRHVLTIRCPDQAFYLDAIRGYLTRHDIRPIGQQTMVARMSCDADSCSLELREPDSRDENNFMLIALHISATQMPEREPLHRDIQAVLEAVDLSVSDFKAMRRFLSRCHKRLEGDDPEAASLLAWINDDRYLYFGLQSNTRRWGICRRRRVFNRIAPQLAEEIASCAPPEKPGLAWLSLTASQHHLYSEVSIEIVRICWRNEADALEYAILIGHFSRSARHVNSSQIPVLSGHWRKLAADPWLRHSAFYRREVRTLFDRMPNHILLATRPEIWLEPLKSVIDIATSRQAIAHWLPSLEGNMDTLLVALAGERFGPKVMQRMLAAIAAKGVEVHGYTSVGVGAHRIILIAIRKPEERIDLPLLNRLVQRSVLFWKDLATINVLRHADTLNIPEALKELDALPQLYQELFPPAQFARDLEIRELIAQSGRILVRIHPRNDHIDIHIYSRTQPSLGGLVDTLRAFALDPVQEWQVPFGKADPSPDHGDARCQCIYISTFTCNTPLPMDNEARQRLRRGLELVLNQEADHDPLNALLILAGLDIDEIAILITLRNHLIQLLPDAAMLPLSEMMLRHPRVSAALLRLFIARHMQGMPKSFSAEARADFHKAMQTVETLTDDRWFRALAELVDASLRTNAFVRQSGAPLAIKIDPNKLSYAPHPRPYREIFVHGVHVEGVHLRAGPIARGGLRFSDRPADFRTEVLELMSTQTIKNGQIVPTGAKGGFVVRGEADATGKKDFVRRQYRLFVRALLELTDNLIQGQALPPAGIRIPEEDMNDAYLVVAADKGTAHFSDDANEEARLAGFWLDDAFASGGTHGYDHKKIGITARGAWVCAAHHFAKLGRDAYKDDISCVGIGDMSGDVFGNGMLINPNIRLLAAFNHRHIFLDPEPDVVKAFNERQRLFNEAAGWDAYRAECISKGGGVFPRTAKRIVLSDAVRKALAIEEEALSGEELIKAILRAPVDLLYNGGIGTYVKAGSESHAEVRDPANNAVRVNGNELRCRVVCEGGNLGFTQRARVEYAANGGIINTDAIDNAAGVNLSDHEVNLKILFASLDDHRGQARRNRILKRQTEAVTEQCLRDNLRQSRALSTAEIDAREHPPRLQRLRDTLRREGWLDEAVAPDIEDNEKLALRPQLCILLGQEKNRIHARLSKAGFDKSSLFADKLLADYFPPALRKRYAGHLHRHALAGEIICTQAVNHVVNHMGLAAVHHLQTLLDNSVAEIVEALLIAETLLETDKLRERIWEQVSDTDTAAHIHHALQENLMRFAEELLRLCDIGRLSPEWLETQRKGLHRFRKSLGVQGIDGMESSRFLALLKTISQAGLATEDAAHLAAMPELAQAACAVHLATALKQPLRRCLQASQACLHVLPFEPLNESLRSPLWGDSDAHSLRREWLHRLALLKKRAITQLLEQPTRSFIKAAEALWRNHPRWPRLEVLIHPSGEETAEEERMRLMLALTLLESIIDPV